MLPSLQTLELRPEGGWLEIRLNRPEARNALSPDLVADLRAVFAAIREDRTVRGVTLRGNGGTFCAGGDLKGFRDTLQAAGDRDAVIAQSLDGARLFAEADSLPQVVIAVVEGAAMAGGFGLACCADAAIVQADAKFGFSETAIGLSPAQIAPYVMAKLGPATARRLLLTAERFDGREAARLGFADVLCETPEEIANAEARLRRQVLRCAPGAVAETKALLATLRTLSTQQARAEAAAEVFADRMTSEEGREGVASFLEKRRPAWAETAE